jgi:hypothetical protein
MQRRTLFKLGAGATALLVIGGGGIAWLTHPGLAAGRLTETGREVFRGVAQGVLDGCLPVAEPARRGAIDAHLARLDDTLAGFPREVQNEVSQLLSLLAAAPTRLAFAGLRSNWAVASIPEIQSSLQSMRTSSLALRQQAYHALRDLTNAAYFADPSTWSAMGYPGPRPT